ncbi:hypothetical protein ATCC90586_001383 [Pythium insidiosum]|nr:hypothetical protein ATCC90586_001383 [Pythium insidiosum]
MADSETVQVFCRVRPPNEREGGGLLPTTKKCVTVPSSDPLQQTVLLQLKGMANSAPKAFAFDRVFHERSTQNEVFEIVGVPVTQACLQGYNGTIFAYGQTGSGKTFTMQGPDDVIDADARTLSDRELASRGLTAMNRESSRSHSVFVLHIQSKETNPNGITKTRTSRFNLVDLAGSERQKSTEAAGERLKEAGSINKSLSALGNVIMGLVEQSAGKNRHVHYRDSKLTFLLKDSLGGNSKTFMIATISPAEDSSHETLSTLKFAQRAKLIRNNAVINEDTTGNVLVLQEEIQRLRRQLQEAQANRNATEQREIQFQLELQQRDIKIDAIQADMEAALHASETLLRETTQEVHVLEGVRADLTSQLSQASARCEELSGTDELATLAAETEKKRAELEELLSTSRSEHEQSKEEIRVLEGVRADLTSQLSQASARCEELSGTVSQLESDLNVAGKEKAALTEELARSKSQHEQDVHAAAARLESTIADHRSVVAGLKDELATLAAETEKKRAELEELRAKYIRQIQNLKGETLAKERELNATQKALEGARAECADVTDKLTKYKASFGKRVKEVEAKEASLTDSLKVVSEKKAKLTARLQEIEKEHTALRNLRVESDKLKRQQEQSKSRLTELELANAQLTKEKERFRKEVNVLSRRLDDVSKETDKLVGHHNKRQKIQHHIRVKEENNRLIEEVRQLTDDKFKLQCRLEKIELALKEKENISTTESPLNSPSSSASSSSQRSVQQKLQMGSSSSSVKDAEDTKATEVLTKKLQLSSTTESPDEHKPAVERVTRPDEEQNDGYSSFEDEEETTRKATSTWGTKRAQRHSTDNQSEAADESGPQKTIASDSEESKTFLRAVYFNDSRRVRDMLDENVVDASVADQVRHLV